MLYPELKMVRPQMYMWPVLVTCTSIHLSNKKNKLRPHPQLPVPSPLYLVMTGDTVISNREPMTVPASSLRSLASRRVWFMGIWQYKKKKKINRTLCLDYSLRLKLTISKDKSMSVALGGSEF